MAAHQVYASYAASRLDTYLRTLWNLGRARCFGMGRFGLVRVVPLWSWHSPDLDRKHCGLERGRWFWRSQDRWCRRHITDWRPLSFLAQPSACSGHRHGTGMDGPYSRALGDVSWYFCDHRSSGCAIFRRTVAALAVWFRLRSICCAGETVSLKIRTIETSLQPSQRPYSGQISSRDGK